MEKHYSIQEVSQIIGVSKETLRYYDRIGLVSPTRKSNRYRWYSRDDLIDLMNIQIMRYADFSLDEIKENLSFRKMENIYSAKSLLRSSMQKTQKRARRLTIWKR
ncbi:MerR family transcriptional regulator [Niallia oryzisoli]|uniref:MerR family transcriptional regulator n=1 Tax=Niallia oryzisoli TaxID=1737571 RepID=A0ABZ2C994_9BACI